MDLLGFCDVHTHDSWDKREHSCHNYILLNTPLYVIWNINSHLSSARKYGIVYPRYSSIQLSFVSILCIYWLHEMKIIETRRLRASELGTLLALSFDIVGLSVNKVHTASWKQQMHALPQTFTNFHYFVFDECLSLKLYKGKSAKSIRAQKLCESRGGRPGLPVPNKPYGFCGCNATLNQLKGCCFLSLFCPVLIKLKQFFSLLFWPFCAFWSLFYMCLSVKLEGQISISSYHQPV